MIESCIVILLLCFLLFGLFQLAQIFMAQEIVTHAAARGARAKIVGFNDFMVYKAVRVATIPTAGRLTYPDSSGGPLAQWTAVEQPNIPLYMGTEWSAQLPWVLDYEDWPTIRYSVLEQDAPPMVWFQVQQTYALTNLFGDFFTKFFYADETVVLDGEVSLDNHYPLYLDVEGGP